MTIRCNAPTVDASLFNFRTQCSDDQFSMFDATSVELKAPESQFRFSISKVYLFEIRVSSFCIRCYVVGLRSQTSNVRCFDFNFRCSIAIDKFRHSSFNFRFSLSDFSICNCRVSTVEFQRFVFAMINFRFPVFDVQCSNLGC